MLGLCERVLRTHEGLVAWAQLASQLDISPSPRRYLVPGAVALLLPSAALVLARAVGQALAVHGEPPLLLPAGSFTGPNALM